MLEQVSDSENSQVPLLNDQTRLSVSLKVSLASCSLAVHFVSNMVIGEVTQPQGSGRRVNCSVLPVSNMNGMAKLTDIKMNPPLCFSVKNNFFALNFKPNEKDVCGHRLFS